MTTLYRAGADAVLSYAGTGSATIWNHFRGDETLLVAQGSTCSAPSSSSSSVRLADSHIYVERAAMVAIEHNGTISGNPDAHAVAGHRGITLVELTEEKFSEVFPHARRRPLHPWPLLKDAPSWCGVHSRCADAHRNAVTTVMIHAKLSRRLRIVIAVQISSSSS